MTAGDRIEYLDRLDQREAQRVQRSALIAWLTIVLAALVAGGLIYAAHRHLNKVQAQIAALDDTVKQKQKDIAQRQKEIAQLEARYQTLYGAVESGEKTRLGLADSTPSPLPDKSAHITLPAPVSVPAPSESVPTVYLQIVDEADRGFAEKMSDALQRAGFKVMGIQRVIRAAGLKRSDVRFYKIADIETAKRIAGVLEHDMHAPLRVTYLGLENSDKVQPNHFEVWFAKQSKPE